MTSHWSARDALAAAAGAAAVGLALLAWQHHPHRQQQQQQQQRHQRDEEDHPYYDSDDDSDDDPPPPPNPDPTVASDPEVAALLPEARRRARRALLGRARAPLPGVLAAVGGTPLLRIASLSEATGCEILAKAEMLEPGGSVKDRVAVSIVREAVGAGALALPRRTAAGTGGLLSDDDDEDEDDDGVGEEEDDTRLNTTTTTATTTTTTNTTTKPLLTEGTAGSTGVSLAVVAAASGCRCFVAMPDDAALEKSRLLRAMGAEVARLRPVSIANPEHPVHVARRAAEQERARQAQQQQGGGEARGGGRGAALFADQFENPANWRAHLQTGEELWMQAAGARRRRRTSRRPPPAPPPAPPRIDAFVSGAGTGGTLAGVSLALKARDARVRAVLVDVAGSSLYNRVARGVAYDPREAEGKRLRHPFDTVAEGVGLNRLTANFARARVDGAVRCSDQEAARMAAHVMRHDGLFVGSSAAVNLVGAVKAARRFGPESRAVVVTLLCDGGARHLTKFHSAEFMAALGLDVSGESWGRTDLSWVED
jgi:cysteine synthase